MNARQYTGLMALMLLQFAAIIYVAAKLPSNLDPATQPAIQSEAKMSNAQQLTNEAPKHSTTDDSALRDAIRSALAQELRPYLDHVAHAGIQQTEPLDVNALPIGVSPELNDNALKQSDQISTQILSKGSWTRDDDAMLNAELSRLTPDQQFKVMERLLSAMERGELLDDRIPRD